MSFIPERDASEVYGQMAPLEASSAARRPHAPRILVISIATEPAGGFQLATQLKFNDLSSPTQATAILDTLEELNNRLSAALDYSPI